MGPLDHAQTKNKQLAKQVQSFNLLYKKHLVIIMCIVTSSLGHLYQVSWLAPHNRLTVCHVGQDASIRLLPACTVLPPFLINFPTIKFGVSVKLGPKKLEDVHIAHAVET